MLTSIVSQEGQITIPIDLRIQLDLQPGDKVALHAHNQEIILVKLKNDITASFGMLCVDKKISLSDIEQAIRLGSLGDHA